MAEKKNVCLETSASRDKKRKRTLSSGSDDEKLTSTKRKCENVLENLNFSPLTNEKFKQNRKIMFFPSSKRQSLEVLKETLQANWKMLKEKMEPTVLASKLHAKNIFGAEAFENVNKCPSRQGKNDAVLQELSSIDPNCTSSVDFVETFCSLLKETGQEDILLQLNFRSRKVLRQLCPDIPQDEYHHLMNFIQQQKETLLEEVEPMVFLDDLVSIGSISYAEKSEIGAASKRRERVTLVVEKIKSAEKMVATKIATTIKDAYPNIYATFEKQFVSCSTKQHNTLKNEKGSQLNMKISIESKPVQDTNEHDDPVQILRKRKAAAEEIERKIFQSLEENPNQLEDMFNHCLIGIDKIQFACVKVYLRSLSPDSLTKLLAYANSGAIKKLIASLIGESRYKLTRDTTVVIEISEGCQVSEKTDMECLCNLDKEAVIQNFQLLRKEIKCSSSVIRRFMVSHLTTDLNRASLAEMRTCDLKTRKKQLLNFLLNQDLPKIYFCILEEEIINADGSSIIRTILKGKRTEQKADKVKPLTISDVSNNKELLLEELEAQWFISSLEMKKNTASQTLLAKMNEPVSRANKIESFVDHLLRESDLSWFAEDLKRYNTYLLDTLLTRKDIMDCENLDFRRTKVALQFCLDEIVEEIDPSILTNRLEDKSKKALQIEQLCNIVERSKRAKRFCMTLIAADSFVIHDVLCAMKFCGYNSIAENIIALAREGPLCKQYRCPNVTNLTKCKERRVFKMAYTLEEIFEEAEALFVSQSDQDDPRNINSVTPPPISKLHGKGRVQSLKGGSESGFFSGSGLMSDDVNTDDDSVDVTKQSEIEKRKKRTKEWVESHPKTGLFSKCSEIKDKETDGVRKYLYFGSKFLYPLSPFSAKNSNKKE